MASEQSEGSALSEKGPGRMQKIFREVLSYALIFLIVFAIRSSFLDNNHIPSGSMIPTMAIGDFIIVNKAAYGVRIPFSDYLGKSVYLTKFKPPRRGDPIVFEYPRDRGTLFVKRVLGVPGDEIEIVDNQVVLNGTPIAGEVVRDQELMDLFDTKFRKESIELSRVQYGEKRFVRASQTAALYHLNTQGKITVPPQSLFVVGDNRDYSSDSRAWGFVPFSHVRGRPLFVWFHMVYPWSSEEFHFRPKRIGTFF